ncbi:hypothetical protein ACFTY7_36850 [Streptomyces sp. NPDC057062]|nr:hypothetical protein [Streptomyces sp. MBT84]
MDALAERRRLVTPAGRTRPEAQSDGLQLALRQYPEITQRLLDI